MKSSLDKIAEAYYQVSAAIASLQAQKDTLSDAIINQSNVSRRIPSAELLTEKHRILVSHVKKCIIQKHTRDAHIKISRCDLRPEYIARNNKRVKTCAALTEAALNEE